MGAPVEAGGRALLPIRQAGVDRGLWPQGPWGVPRALRTPRGQLAPVPLCLTGRVRERWGAQLVAQARVAPEAAMACCTGRGLPSSGRAGVSPGRAALGGLPVGGKESHCWVLELEAKSLFEAKR